jgi:hypothetical protein
MRAHISFARVRIGWSVFERRINARPIPSGKSGERSIPGAGRAAGIINVVTPDEAVEIGMNNAIVVQPLMGGLKPELGWKCLEMYVKKVLPRIKDAPANRRKAQP